MKKILARSIMLALALPGLTSVAMAKPKSEIIILENTIRYTCTSYDSSYVYAGHGETLMVDDETMTAMEITNCSSVKISNVNFVGPGLMNRNQGTKDGPVMIGGHALLIKNPVDSTEDMKVFLSKITVEGFGNHSIYMADIDADGNCAGGTGGDCGKGSDGSIDVNMQNVVIKNGGFGGQDADGLRVDERGAGDIRLNAQNILLQGIGADGIELDEGDDGDVVVNMNNAYFEGNGRYCLMDDADIAYPLGSVDFPLYYAEEDNRICNDDGDADVDDAFDIDEAGKGSIIVRINNANILTSWDEGLDFDEAGEGDVELKLTNIYAESNRGSAIKADEENEGRINGAMKNVVVKDTWNDEGIQFTELSDGNIIASIENAEITRSYKDGVKMEQFADADEDVDDSGDAKGRLDVNDSVVENNDADKNGRDQIKVSGMDLYIDGVEQD